MSSNLPLPQRLRTRCTQLAPLVLEHQTKGTIAGAWLNKENPDHADQAGRLHSERVARGLGPDAASPISPGLDWLWATAFSWPPAPDEFLMAGDNVQVTFSLETPGPEFVGLAEQEAGRFENGKWVVTRYLGGDDSTLRKNLANAVALNQSGFGVRLIRNRIFRSPSAPSSA
jgi:hypothetical protein